MAVMTIRHPEASEQRLTVDDLAHTPDDGRRYELVDGKLDVSPAPVFDHSRVDSRLTYYLIAQASDEHDVLSGPGINFNAERTHHRIPDLAIIHVDDVQRPYLTRPPLLAVEILSPESTLRDSNTKRDEYAKFGIESYWIINPNPDKVGISEMRLEDGHYRDVAQVYGEELFETELPFPVRLVPHWLLADGPWKQKLGG